MVKNSLSLGEQELVRNYSQKGRSFQTHSNGQSQESCGELSSVTEGVIHSSSGYLAVCDAVNLQVYNEKTIPDRSVSDLRKEGSSYRINLNSRMWVPPGLLQGLDFLVFRNLFGDGLFGVVSSKNRFYVETHSPSWPDEEFLDEVRKGEKIKEEKGSRAFYFEGFVGIESGSAAITDPEIHLITYPQGRFEISTILKVGPGKYACKFIDENRKLSIRKIKS